MLMKLKNILMEDAEQPKKCIVNDPNSEILAQAKLTRGDRNQVSDGFVVGNG